MAKRTKQQKKVAEARRKDTFVFSETGVAMVPSPDQKKKDSEVVTSTSPDLQKRISKDLTRTLAISLFVFVLLFGIYFYLR